MSNFVYKNTTFKDLKIIQFIKHSDSRGFYSKFFYYPELLNHIDTNISEISEISALARSLRGFHIQLNQPQAKLIRVVKGSIIDYVIDLRKESSTFCNVFSICITSNTNDMLYIPSGFAHGIYALEDSTIIYTSSTPYDDKSNCGINFLDPVLKIEVPPFDPNLLSLKDKNLPTLEHFLKQYYGKL